MVRVDETQAGRILGVLLLLLASLAAPPTSEAAVSTVGIDYKAPPDCPSAAQFIALVTGRSRGTMPIKEGAGELRFAVEIQNLEVGKEGRVRRASGPGTGDQRVVIGVECGELVEALALTTALSLEEPVASVGAPPVVVASALSRPGSRGSWLVGAGFGAAGLLVPRPLAEAALYVESRAAEWPSGAAIHRPDVRLRLSLARNDVLVDPGKAAFSFWTAGLELCPLGMQLAQPLAIRVCGTGEVGVLAGEGIEIDNPGQARTFWRAAGGLTRLRWAWGRRAVLDLQGGAVLPLRVTQFVFDMPRVSVAAVPTVVWRAGVTLGLAIP